MTDEFATDAAGTDAATRASSGARSDLVHREVLLSVTGLDVELPARTGGRVRVLDDVSFDVPRGRVVGIVGESGSGKTMLLRALLGILPDGATPTWRRVLLDGHDITAELPRRRLPAAMVFQDPMTSFDPLVRIGAHLTEVVQRFQRVGRRRAAELAREALVAVRIPDPDRVLTRYPHELSGGMRQRAMIAMALLANPELLLADEPTTALDATIQAQILALLRSLQSERALTVVIVTHDLAVVAAVCDDVLVMKDGRIVESGEVDRVFREPRHPYTRELLAAAPAEPAEPEGPVDHAAGPKEADA
ncbi:ABC transporter ATP-binding protein [Microbacterium sp. M3]|uniref:ABC transporter ATP-binding protein n=1 Tax=Microbacterium arthrosphaerae TaxID=792652 RepID=A0ABU4H239_9MICO|nr:MULTISPECIES: ABC transporter ATP-binding protein [Microbacterium]MDW4573399.1 ABC transporter ATP-binding protein [Microbacterium arthrosphaerae]MDW7607254.1 ABC transporter ATP-binding protein [Microbacterium sp. M3]